MKPRVDGSFIFTLLLGVFVLVCLVAAEELPDSLQITIRMAGYSTLLLVVLLLIGHFKPGLLRWTETALQDVWGGKGGDASSVGQAGAGAEGGEEPVPWPAVARSMGYALGFLALVFILGFYLIPPLFIATYLIVDARVPARWAIFSGVAATALLIGGMQAVNVDVWLGMLPEIIPGYLGGSMIPPI